MAQFILIVVFIIPMLIGIALTSFIFLKDELWHKRILISTLGLLILTGTFKLIVLAFTHLK